MKRLCSTGQLIQHMKNKGISFSIETEEDAANFLTYNNYYMKLASYRSNYKKYSSGPKTGQYINLEYAYLRELSTIDMHLRYVLSRMSLDIEHALKVKLLREIEQNPKEDGYTIIQKFLAKDNNIKILSKIQSHKASDYCKGLIEKYYPYFPAWVFVELISFGDLTHLCSFYHQYYGIEIGNRILLNSVKDVRNATSHSNCLINVLSPGNNIPHGFIITRTKRIDGISKNSCNKKLKNKFIYDFVCLLFAYDEIVSSSPSKKKTKKDLYDLFGIRMMRHSDWFASNNLIVSSYNFIKKVLDKISEEW